MNAIQKLGTLADYQRTRRATPKHAETRLEKRTQQDKSDAKREAQFRADVWRLDEGRCAHCHRRVVKTLRLQANRGEVHHLIGRNVKPEDRFNVARARLLCREHHEQATRHQIVIQERGKC